MERGEADYDRYPFLEGAGGPVASLKLADFEKDPYFQPLIDEALARIRAAAEGSVYGGGDKSNPKSNLYSFAIAVHLLGAADNGALRGRFALAEARRSEGFLAEDLKKGGAGSQVISIFEEVFGTAVAEEDNIVRIPVADYLRHAVSFRERTWDLVNREVYKGMVSLKRKELVRLVRNRVTQLILEKIPPKAVAGGLLAGAAAETKKMTEAVAVPRQAAGSGGFPPCIKLAVKELEDGKNLPHSGRFMLGTYMLAAGMGKADVAALFKGAPDYDERVTNYQVENLARGEYKCPGCDNIRTNDMCRPDGGCEGIRHPLQYRRDDGGDG